MPPGPVGGGDGLHGVGSRMCDLLRMDWGWDELRLAQQDLPAGCGHGPDRAAGMSGTRATGATRATCAVDLAVRIAPGIDHGRHDDPEREDCGHGGQGLWAEELGGVAGHFASS